jgi:hypothetical protein
MNTAQQQAYNDMGQLIMDKMGCTSEEAAGYVEMLMGDMLAALNSGALADDAA